MLRIKWQSSLLIFTTCIYCVFGLSIMARATMSDAMAICAHVIEAKNKNINNGAKYIAGVDVHGNKVVPADIDANGTKFINDPIIMPIKIDLIDKFNLNMPSEITLEPTIANLKIFLNGRVEYGGDDITDHLLQICDNNKEKIENNITQEHGQGQGDPVIYSDKIEGQYPDDIVKIKPHYND